MAIRFRCPNCSKKIEADDQFAGRVAPCPRCRQSITVPELSDPELTEPPPAVEVAASTPVSADSKRPAEPEASLVRPAMKIDFEDLIDMTAMVDIVFFLLIFFLVTSMHALDATIPLPAPTPQEGSESQGGSSGAAEEDASSIVVNIDANDTIRIDGTEVFGPEDLLFKLRDLKNGPGRPDKLLVIGNGDASHGATVMVLDAGHDVGMESVRLAVRDEPEE